MSGHIHFNENNTWEPEKVKAFYGETCGWTFEAIPMPNGPDYTLCKADDAVVAAIFTYSLPRFEGARDFWLAYIAVDDVDARAAQVAKLGGHVRREPFDIPGFGRVCVLDDSTGATLAFIQPA